LQANFPCCWKYVVQPRDSKDTTTDTNTTTTTSNVNPTISHGGFPNSHPSKSGNPSKPLCFREFWIFNYNPLAKVTLSGDMMEDEKTHKKPGNFDYLILFLTTKLSDILSVTGRVGMQFMYLFDEGTRCKWGMDCTHCNIAYYQDALLFSPQYTWEVLRCIFSLFKHKLITLGQCTKTHF
jgi:hypothetical protein